MSIFGHPSSWLLWGLTWLALSVIVSLAMALVARGGQHEE